MGREEGVQWPAIYIYIHPYTLAMVDDPNNTSTSPRRIGCIDINEVPSSYQDKIICSYSLSSMAGNGPEKVQ